MIEWNGIPLTGISHDEVSRIISTQVGDEIEVVIRTDINMMANQSYQAYEQQPNTYPQVILQHNHPIDESHQQMPGHSQHSHQQQSHQSNQYQSQQYPAVDHQGYGPVNQQSYPTAQHPQQTGKSLIRH